MKSVQRNHIGIMSVVHEGRPPFGKQTYFFEDMVRFCGLDPERLFFFSPLEWEMSSAPMDGFVHVNGTWKKAKRPIPHVIYDRSFSSHPEQKDYIEKCREVLSQLGHLFMNPLDFTALLNDKFAFHEFLVRNDISTMPALPVENLRDSDFLMRLKHPKVYIKPVFGSKGEGIYVLEKHPGGYMLYDEKGNGTLFKEYSELHIFIERCIESENKYFIQEAANIAKFGGAPFDVRVLVQNYGDRYEITGKAVRIGKVHAVTSNLNSGGNAIPISELEDFFQQNYAISVLEMEAKIDLLCLDCSEVIKQEYGDFCEIGFDVLITKDKGPILLEGNAKPSRWVFVKMADYLESKGMDNTYYLGRRKETVSVPMIYADFLAGKK